MPEKRNEAEDVELEFKRLQVETMREQLAERRERREAIVATRERATAEWKEGERLRLRRQSMCQHRKGGKNNKFANGSDNNHSIINNTYPDGKIVIMCTRCFKEVEKPTPQLKKTDPKKYAVMLDEWKIWSAMPTDNTPSGSKMFERVA